MSNKSLHECDLSTERKNFLPLLGEIAFFLFIACFFLKLGSDTLEHPQLRLIYLGFLTAGLLFLFSRFELSSLKSWAAIFFAGFFGYELVRLLWAVWLLAVRGAADSLLLPLNRYVASSLTWFLYFGFFLSGFLFFRVRSRIQHLLWFLSWCGFILAFTAIPPLIMKGYAGYHWPNGGVSFFPPLVYFHPFVSKYLVASYIHPNYMGDLIAFGFFPALGILFYALQQLRERFSLSRLILPGFMAATQALAIVLFFSRAAILCLAGTFIVFLSGVLSKYPSRAQAWFAGLVFAIITIFLLWAGNVQATWKELKTLQREKGVENSSSATNLEGAKRAMAIYQNFPIWGIGTRGYQSVSQLFASGKKGAFDMSRFKAFCHYLQTLAEEGIGAYVYFLFILAYFFESFVKLFQTKSRFQFMAGLSLVTPVLMIMVHSAVSPTMDYFSFAMLVYILMGAGLGVLRQDFEHS